MLLDAHVQQVPDGRLLQGHSCKPSQVRGLLFKTFSHPTHCWDLCISNRFYLILLYSQYRKSLISSPLAELCLPCSLLLQSSEDGQKQAALSSSLTKLQQDKEHMAREVHECKARAAQAEAGMLQVGGFPYRGLQGCACVLGL